MPNCELCGEPMPEGEEMFKYHGLSGPCPKQPRQVHRTDDRLRTAYETFRGGLKDNEYLPPWANAQTWIRDLMKVAYLQGTLDGLPPKDTKP